MSQSDTDIFTDSTIIQSIATLPLQVRIFLQLLIIAGIVSLLVFLGDQL